MSHTNLILQQPILQSLSSEDISLYLSSGSFQVRTFGHGQIIHMDGDPCKSFDIILEGQIMIDRIDEEGNLLSIVTFNEGDTLGGNVLYSKMPRYLMTITAKSKVVLLSIKKEAVSQLLESNAIFRLQFIEDISNRAAILGQRIRRYGTKSLRAKLTDYLNHEYAKQKQNPIILPVGKKALAEQMGVVRTSVSRELKSMEDEGLIKVDHKIITLHL